MSRDLLGQTLKDRYFLRELAGSGGMADVFLSWDKQRSTKIAVKVLKQDLADQEKTFTLFTQEAELLRRLEHPNIVRIYEFDQDDEVSFLVMDWVDGIDLRKKLQKQNQPLTLVETSHILGPICSALNYAHNNNIFHCDVKPPNILIHQDGRVLLTDFGVARLSGISGSGGTPPYMSPEQFTDDMVGIFTDIYGLGITLYEMLSGGHLPFRGDSPNSNGTSQRERIAWEHVHMPIPPLRILNPNIPAPIEQVIMKALDKSPDNRFPSTLKLVEAFEQARLMAGPEKKNPGLSVDMLQTIIQPLKPIIAQAINSIPQPQPQPIRQTPPPGSAVRPYGPHLYSRSGFLAGQVVQFPIRGTLLIGRNSSNQIYLPESSVSRLHASLIITQRGIYIQDEGSSLGTQLNGQNIPPNYPVLLKHGDIIQIGYQQVFEFRIR